MKWYLLLPVVIWLQRLNSYSPIENSLKDITGAQCIFHNMHRLICNNHPQRIACREAQSCSTWTGLDHFSQRRAERAVRLLHQEFITLKPCCKLNRIGFRSETHDTFFFFLLLLHWCLVLLWEHKKNTWWVQNLCTDPLCAWEDFTAPGYIPPLIVQEICFNKVP